MTLDFINSVLGNVGLGPLSHLTICNPFHVNESVTDKESILDIKAEDESHRIYNIEMQLQGNSLFYNRVLYYWAKAYASQLSKGESYKRLSPVICINVVDFELFPAREKAIHHCFLLKSIQKPTLVLTDHQMLHFLCLTTFRKKHTMIETPLSDWLSWFCHDGDNMKGLETVLERNERVREANEKYQQFTADRNLMERYEARFKFLCDMATFREEAQDRYLEGVVVGEETANMKTARLMRKNGEPIEKISQYTGLSRETIESLPE